MATFLHGLYPLKIAVITVGLTCTFGVRAFSQIVPDPAPPGVPDSTAAVTRALQPPKNFEPPRITPPAISEIPIKVNPSLLPPKAIAIFPQFDGDEFFFVDSGTGAQLGPASSVFQGTVRPLLSAIGFKDPTSRFRPLDAHHMGREMPTANLSALASISCREARFRGNKRAQKLCAVLTDKTQMTPEVDTLLKSGMDMMIGQFEAAMQRVEVEYFFAQERKVKASEYRSVLKVPKKVPVEHTGIRVEGRKGEAGLFVSGRVINDDETVTNVIKIEPDAVLAAARKALKKKGIKPVNDGLLTPVELLLLPYRSSEDVHKRPTLKYAYRTALLADFRGMKGTFYLWLDAGTGELLQLVPRMGSATATGKTFNRDPSTLPETGFAKFEIDGSSSDPTVEPQFTLKLTGVLSRLDRKGDGVYDDEELIHPAAEFDQASFSSTPTVASVACAGSNNQFAQVDLMATASRYRELFNNAGPVLSQFPRTERRIVLDGDKGCNADYDHYGFYFGTCMGSSDSSCPDKDDLNPAHDHTVVAHELGHPFTGYQYGFLEDLNPQTKPQGDRLTSWCLGTTLEDGQRPAGTSSYPCPKPAAPDLTFHDFADAWSQVLEDTNCFGGWWGKNRGGTNYSLHCTYQGTDPPPAAHKPHDEGGGWPRLSEVGMTFDPNDPQDHFPEHRKTGQQGEYSDMQIAAAALWAVRQGLKSRDPVMGELLYYIRFVRTLATTGWLASSPALVKVPTGTDWIFTDRDIYRYLVELEVKMVNRWARFLNPGESTVNKVVSGFARAGIFMIPWGCLDGYPTTPAGSPCESGADAVIDVAPGEDHLARNVSRPTFHIWTGPLYKFDGNGTGSNFIPSAGTPSPCNTEFQVEIATDKDFTPANRITSTPASGVWRTVSNSSSSGCHATWQPDVNDWNAVKGTSGETYVYYRVTTRKGLGVDVRVSISPAKGLFGAFDPPYLVVNDSVLLDTSAPSVPGNLIGSAASASGINLSWSPSTDNVGVAGYGVLRNGTEIGTTAATSYMDNGLPPSTTHTYTVRAFDAAGNLSAQSSGVSVTTLLGSANFPSRCAAPGVLVCRGFDSAAEFSPAVWPQTGLYPAADGLNHGSWDSATKSSGGGSLRFEIKGGTQSNSAGFWREALTRLFGLGQTFYVQFRQRFSPEMLNLMSGFGGSGWMQVIFHESNATCAGIELTTANALYRNIPTMSSNCGTNKLVTPFAGGGVLLQQGETGISGYNCHESNPASPTCASYRPDQWITFYYKVTVGNWGQANTVVNAWIGYEGQPLKQWINVTTHTILPEFPGPGFDYLTLTPYDRGKDGRSHVTATIWYDELIISTQPIAAPSGPNDATPPVPPTNLHVQ